MRKDMLSTVIDWGLDDALQLTEGRITVLCCRIG